MEAVALDIGRIMTPTFVVPDTSGLAPLTLPESFLERHDTPQPYPDAIRRFETAMVDDVAPKAAARAFYASLANTDMPQKVAQGGNTVAAAADKPVAASCDSPVPVVQPQNPVAASCDPPVSGQNTLRDAGGTQFIASESKGASQLPPDATVSGKPEAVVADKPATLVADRQPVAVSADKPVVGQPQNPVAASCDPPVSGQNTLRDAGGTQFIASEFKGASQLPPDAAVSGKPESVVVDKPVTEVAGKQPVAVSADKPVVVQPQNPVAASCDPPMPVGQLPNSVAASSDSPVSGQNTLRETGGTQFIASEIKSAPAQAAEATDEPEEVAVLQASPVQVAVPDMLGGASVQAVSEVAAVSAASARTEVIVDTVNQIVDAVVGQIVVTPSLVQGEGEVRMTLKPTVLDGSDITLTAKDGTLTVAVTPATPAAEQAAAVALPQLETALAEHAPAFRHVAVALVAKKGKIDETA